MCVTGRQPRILKKLSEPKKISRKDLLIKPKFVDSLMPPPLRSPRMLDPACHHRNTMCECCKVPYVHILLQYCPPLSFLYSWLLSRVDCSLRRKWVIVLFALCTYSCAAKLWWSFPVWSKFTRYTCPSASARVSALFSFNLWLLTFTH